MRYFIVLSALVSSAYAFDPPNFIRGDANLDGNVNIADAVTLLNAIWARDITNPARCVDASDANDDGRVSMLDVTFLVNFLFLNGRNIPAPFPQAGEDPTEDQITCNG